MRIKLLVGETDTLSFDDIQKMFSDRLFYAAALLTALLVIFANPYHYFLPVSMTEWTYYFTIQGPIFFVLYVCFKFAMVAVARAYAWRYIYEPAVTLLVLILSLPFIKASADLAFETYRLNLTELILIAGFYFLILETCISLCWYRFVQNRILRYSTDTKSPSQTGQAVRWLTVGAYNLEVEDLIWIKSEGHNLRIKSAYDDDIVVRENLRSVMSQLHELDAVLVHRSTLIFRNGIEDILKEPGRQMVKTSDNTIHTVAKSRELALLSWLEMAIAQQNKTTPNEPTTAVFVGGNSIKISDTELVRLMVHPLTVVYWALMSGATIFLNPSVLFSELPYVIWLIFWVSQSSFFFLLYTFAIIVFNAMYRSIGAKYSLHVSSTIITAFLVHHGSVQFANWFTIPMGYEFKYSVFFAAACALMLELFASLYVQFVYPKIADEIKDDAVVDSNGLELKVQIDTHSLALGDILHVKSDGHYLQVATKRQSYYVKGTIASLEAQISDRFAVSPHRSYWIPRHAIKATQQTGGKLMLKLSDGHAVNVARARRDAVLYWIQNGRSAA